MSENKPLRVLIADDEPLIRRGLRNALANLPAVELVAECENGAQAIQEILSNQPDLVLLDVQMPDCDGLEVLRQVGPERMPSVIESPIAVTCAGGGGANTGVPKKPEDP